MHGVTFTCTYSGLMEMWSNVNLSCRVIKGDLISSNMSSVDTFKPLIELCATPASHISQVTVYIHIIYSYLRFMGYSSFEHF